LLLKSLGEVPSPMWTLRVNLISIMDDTMNKKKKASPHIYSSSITVRFFRVCAFDARYTLVCHTETVFRTWIDCEYLYVYIRYNIKMYSAIRSRTLKIIVQGVCGCQKYTGPKGSSCVLFLFLFDQHGNIKNASRRVFCTKTSYSVRRAV